jgi:hypothetical protein
VKDFFQRVAVVVANIADLTPPGASRPSLSTRCEVSLRDGSPIRGQFEEALVDACRSEWSLEYFLQRMPIVVTNIADLPSAGGVAKDVFDVCRFADVLETNGYERFSAGNRGC